MIVAVTVTFSSLNATTCFWNYALGVGASLKPELVMVFCDFRIECKYTNDRAIVVYSSGAVANPQFAFVAEIQSAI